MYVREFYPRGNTILGSLTTCDLLHEHRLRERSQLVGFPRLYLQ